MTDKLPELPIDDIRAILYQCDRGNVSLPWLIDALRGIVERDAIAAPMTDKLPPLPEPRDIPGFYDIDARKALRYTADQMRAYAEEAVRLEREACELIAISWSDKSYEADMIAAEIRARSEVIDDSASPIN